MKIDKVKAVKYLVKFLAVFFVSVLGTVVVLYSLSGTSWGENIRKSLGLSDFKTFNISTSKTEKIIVEESSAIIKTTKDVNPSVVSITSGRVVNDFFGFRTVESAGSGFIVTSDGLIATNKHVVDGADTFTITTSDRRTFEGKLVATDPSTDLALIKIEERGLSAVPLGDSDRVQVGQWVIAIGNALGEYQNSVTVGVISAKDRKAQPMGSSGRLEYLDGLLQTDAAINSGNSGGPLLDLQGQVIGINTAVSGSGQNIGFAIAANDLKKALDSYRTNGKILRPFLGVRYQTLTKLIAQEEGLSVEQGAYIFSTASSAAVVEGSPAQKANLQDGDIIIKVNSDSVTEINPLSQILRKYDPGNKVTLTIVRNKQELKVELTLGTLGE